MLPPPRKPPLNPQPSPAATLMSSLKPKQSSTTTSHSQLATAALPQSNIQNSKSKILHQSPVTSNSPQHPLPHLVTPEPRSA
jgi:hypothetical protein